MRVRPLVAFGRAVPDEAVAATALLERVLGLDLIAVWLHGSAVADGLRPDSDVDVLALTRTPVGATRRAELLRGLLEVSGDPARGCQLRPVELGVVVRDDVVPWRYPPVCDLLYGEWLRAAVESGETFPRETSPDLAILLTTVRDLGVPMFGPPARDLLDPVPPADLRSAMLAGIAGLRANLLGDERNVLLTLARIIVTLRTGRIVAKDVAALEVLGRPDGLTQADIALLRAARDGYLGRAVDRWQDPALTRDLAERLIRTAVAASQDGGPAGC